MLPAVFKNRAAMLNAAGRVYKKHGFLVAMQILHIKCKRLYDYPKCCTLAVRCDKYSAHKMKKVVGLSKMFPLAIHWVSLRHNS